MAATNLKEKTCAVCNVKFKGWNCSLICSVECRVSSNLSIKNRTCYKCNNLKPIEDFYITNPKTLNRRSSCRRCDQIERFDFKKKNPGYNKQIDNNRKKKWAEKYPIKCRESILKCKYGITLDIYQQMLDKQNGVCAICHKTELKINKSTNTPKRLAIDHCHKTGKIRGLLCFHCNSSIGKFSESVDNLRMAIEYLNKHNK